MLKKPILYTDYNGKTVTENFYFNLSLAELIKLQMSTMTLSEDMASTTGGLEEHIQEVINSRSGKRIIEMFDLFVDASFGVRSEDGRKFTKNAEVLADFKATPAYDVLFMELVTDADAGSKFINGIMPSDLLAEATKVQNSPTDNVVQLPEPAPLSREDFEKGETKKQPRSKQELLQAFREKNAPKEPDWRTMTEAEAMALPENEFYKWLNAQPAATPQGVDN